MTSLEAPAGEAPATDASGWLLRREPRSPCPDSSTTPAADQETLLDSGRHLICAACSRRITRNSERISVADSHEHQFFNPAGFLFHIGCFRSAPGCFSTGQPTMEFTWFPGFAWRHALCDGCGQHLGWRFENSEANAFFGLVLSRLVEAEEGGD